MKRSALAFLSVLFAGPMLAQTIIGGGSCNSSTLNGVYAVSLSGRKVTSLGGFTNVFQANGSATFDGQSKVTITLTTDSGQGVAMPVTWSGSYSLQANCSGVVTISSGGSATLYILPYAGGSNFVLAGSDGTYSYSGSGNSQASVCSTASLTGAYTFDATGFALNSAAISGVGNGAGLLQFDGQGHVTANINLFQSGVATTTLTLTGTYSVSNCAGTAMLTDSSANAYVMSFSVFTGTTANSTAFFVTLAQNSKFILSGAAHAVNTQPNTTTTCNAASLSGTYGLALNGRMISSAGVFGSGFQSNGTITFDGQGKVTLSGISNTNLASGKQFAFSGTYNLGSNCSGIVTLLSGNTGNFTLVVWNAGRNFNIIGSDANYVYSGSGTSALPEACALSTLSGEYVFETSGFTLSGTTQNGVADEAGILQFDGLGNVTAAYAVASPGTAPSSTTATGTYTVMPGCLASATLTDSTGKSTALQIVVQGTYGDTLNLIESNSQFVRAGTAHAAFVNPSEAIGNVASYAVNATPPGSVFVIFGQNLATRSASATSTTLPTQLLATTVTVNGIPAPLFFVDQGQIDAQMPWEIPGGSIATVVVKNGTSTSNSVGVYVPATGTPGISAYGDNRAVVVNQNGRVNSASDAAAVGDVVVAYFTGGGPVMPSGRLVTGTPAPLTLAPITGDYSVTVGGMPASVRYIGLTPGSIGLYQVNFIVPQIARGTYPVVITIAGQASNRPVMTVSN